MNCPVCGERIEPMGRYGSDKREASLIEHVCIDSVGVRVIMWFDSHPVVTPRQQQARVSPGLPASGQSWVNFFKGGN